MRLLLKLAILIYGLFIAGVVFVVEAPGYRIELEGLSSDSNFRDVGTSLNDCMQKSGIDSPTFKKGRLFRANKRFSGHSCDRVGNPSAILTLNHKPQKHLKYFCLTPDGQPKVGFIPTSQIAELKDLEFVEIWKNLEQSEPACEALQMAAETIHKNNSLLVHCEAGRDRTGAFSAFLAALTLEGLIPVDKLGEILECDYRKSKNLVTDKYGRVAQLLVDANTEYGSFLQFIKSVCPQVNPELLLDLRLSLLEFQ